MSGRSVNLTTLFLGRLRPPKRLTSTSCTYFRQQLTTALLEKAEGETKVCCQTGYRTQDPWLTSQVPYRLRYAVRRDIQNPWTMNIGQWHMRLHVCSLKVHAINKRPENIFHTLTSARTLSEIIEIYPLTIEQDILSTYSCEKFELNL